MGPTVTDRKRVPVLRDVLDGALRGDFARQLGPAGALTQMVLGFVPVIGTLAALRDLLADLAVGDALGALLNLVALIPVLGGFAKTAEVLHHLSRLHGSLRNYSSSEATHPATDLVAAAPGARRPNAYSLLSLLLGVIAPVLSPTLAILGMTRVSPNLGLTAPGQRFALLLLAIFLAPVLGILSGHLATRRAKRRHGRHAPRTLARIGLALGYLYLFVFAAILAVVLAVSPLS